MVTGVPTPKNSFDQHETYQRRNSGSIIKSGYPYFSSDTNLQTDGYVHTLVKDSARHCQIAANPVARFRLNLMGALLD